MQFEIKEFDTENKFELPVMRFDLFDHIRSTFKMQNV